MDGETGESRRSTCRRNQRIASFGQQRSHGGEEADGWYLCRGPGRFTHRQAKDDSGDKANAAADHEGRSPADPLGQPTATYSRSEEHTSELPVTNAHLVCRLLLEKKNKQHVPNNNTQ